MARRLETVIFVLATACHETPSEPAARPAPEKPRSAATASPPEPILPASAPAASVPNDSFRYPGAPRVVAIGDIHGDLAAARRALRLAGAIDKEDDWVGGNLVVVQTGDEIDRGDDDRAVLDLFARLAGKARAAGGRVHALNGNHEIMNVSGDFRYVTPGGFAAFAKGNTSASATSVANVPAESRGRAAAFEPGGSYARILAERDSVAMVGDTVFVHGGVTADHVRYGLDRLNDEVKRWMRHQGPIPDLAQDPEGPLWTRRYSDEKAGIDCEAASAALAALSARRMVIGHTPQPDGISPACGDRVWRIDSGLSAYYGGPTQVLEITGDAVRILKKLD